MAKFETYLLQWANICCNKYSHSRVTNFKTHLKHNNSFTQLIYDERHLPDHMQLKFSQRLIRFLFMPISLLGCIFIMNYSPNFDEISELCYKRNVCYSYCTNDNFPRLSCDNIQVPITYNGNEYLNFFRYSDP